MRRSVSFFKDVERPRISLSSVAAFLANNQLARLASTRGCLARIASRSRANISVKLWLSCCSLPSLCRARVSVNLWYLCSRDSSTGFLELARLALAPLPSRGFISRERFFPRASVPFFLRAIAFPLPERLPLFFVRVSLRLAESL